MKQTKPYSVIYSDNDIVVFNKASGILTASDRYDKDAPRLDLIAEPEFGRLMAVHRIDKDTSGIVIYARNADAHRNLSIAFERRLVKKVYHALVHGRPAWDTYVSEAKLLPDGDAHHRTIVNKRLGKASCTEFKLIGTCGPFSWIEARPLTGRTHQIRVHAKYLGHPVVGDKVYGKEVKGLNGQLLHAYKLSFTHPRTKKLVTFEAKLPDYFENYLKKLK